MRPVPTDEFLRLIKEMPDIPLALADFPAQATGFLLDALESLSVLDALEERETRMTVLMFGSDDPTAMTSMAKTYLALGERVDYVLVKNPARFRSAKFDEIGHRRGVQAETCARPRITRHYRHHPNRD